MDLQSYVFLPGEEYSGRDLLVAKHGILQGISWKQAHFVLQKKDAFMLPPRVFFHFLHYLNKERTYDGKGNRISDEEKKQLMFQFTDEWLDGHFTEDSGIIYFERSHLLKGNGLIPQVRTIYDSLKSDRVSFTGINLTELILQPTETGLPGINISRGEDYFLSPRLDGVVRWSSWNKNKGIACRKHPNYIDPTVTVREARFRENIERPSLEIIDEDNS